MQVKITSNGKLVGKFAIIGGKLKAAGNIGMMERLVIELKRNFSNEKFLTLLPKLLQSESLKAIPEDMSAEEQEQVVKKDNVSYKGIQLSGPRANTESPEEAVENLKLPRNRPITT